jgi:hypothetical protein
VRSTGVFVENKESDIQKNPVESGNTFRFVKLTEKLNEKCSD